MYHRWTQVAVLTFVFLLCAVGVNAQEPHAQLSPFLSRVYFNFNFGFLHSPFTNAHLNNGYVAETAKHLLFPDDSCWAMNLLANGPSNLGSCVR